MAVIDLSPAVLDLKGIRAGDRNLVQVSLTSEGQPLDLTGLTVSAQARKKSTDEPAAITADIDVTDATAGKLLLRWPGDDVRALLAGTANWTGVWDLQIQSGTNDPVTVVAGAFSADMDVTRP